MDNRTRILIAGFGAIVPIFLTLIAIDVHTMFKQFDPELLAGWIVRCITLFAIGAGYVWIFHNLEIDRAKIFQFGIVAPASLMVLMNGLSIPRPDQHAFLIGLIQPALAAEVEEQNPIIKEFSESEKALAQFIAGLTVNAERKSFYLIEFKDKDLKTVVANAKETEIDLKNKKMIEDRVEKSDVPHFGVQIYAPYKDLPYTVVIAEELTEHDALILLDRIEHQGYRDVALFDLSCGCFKPSKEETKK